MWYTIKFMGRQGEHLSRFVALFIATTLCTCSLAASAASGCAGFTNPQKNYSSNRADPARMPLVLPIGPALEQLTYLPRGETKVRSLDEYLQIHCVTGLLVLHKGEVVFERYLQGVRPSDSLSSASMSKSILALLIGIAVNEGRLRIDEKVMDVLPDFAASAFGKATLEDLLRMTTGVALISSYDRRVVSDNQATNPMFAPNQNVLRYLRDKRDTHAEGKVFDYNGTVSAMLGAMLRARTGRSNTDYLAEKLWQPMGASDPGYWIKNNNGEEGVQGQFAATLRDYARVGLLVMRKGMAGDASVVPATWIADMVALRRDKPQPSSLPWYGLHIWIPQAAGGRSMFLGTNGQAIFIDPVAQTVIVHTSNSPDPYYRDGNTHLFALRDAIVQSLKNR